MMSFLHAVIQSFGDGEASEPEIIKKAEDILEIRRIEIALNYLVKTGKIRKKLKTGKRCFIV